MNISRQNVAAAGSGARVDPRYRAASSHARRAFAALPDAAANSSTSFRPAPRAPIRHEASGSCLLHRESYARVDRGSRNRFQPNMREDRRAAAALEWLALSAQGAIDERRAGNPPPRLCMMLFGLRTMRGGKRAVQLRVGTLLAVLALFSQMVISLLPMPAMGSPLGESSICQLDISGQQTPPKPGKSPGHRNMDCPVCQAAQLLGNLMPPSPAALPPAPTRVQLADFSASDTIRPHRAAASHQARAPPPSV